VAKESILYARAKALLYYLLWWSFWTVVQIFVLHRLGLDWRHAFTDAAVSNALMAVFGFVAIVLYSFYQPGSTNHSLRLVFAFVITVFFCITVQAALQAIYNSDVAYLQFLDQSMPLRFICALLILFFITLFFWAMHIVQERKTEQARKNDSEKMLRDAELLSLRQQMQPHFIFNSLNSISALTVSQPHEARKMIESLSEFLRGTLKKSDLQTTTLDEELQQIRLYLDIEEKRFGDRMKVEMDVAEDAGKSILPPLLLQPLIENAIKHGLYNVLGKVTISLTARLLENFLEIALSNPVDATAAPLSKGAGFGLSSVRRRLFLLYGRNDLISSSSSGQVYTTVLRIPQTNTANP
jgi:two-component system LytT family sensor kinase